MNDICLLQKSSYPETLRNMPGAPRKLYIRGQIHEEKDRKYLCVVGSRNWTPYGRDSVNKIINGLRGYPITIVSGLALGIDSIAHIAALNAGLHCIAFPGSTLDWEKIYPNSHTELARMIVERGGALVSQWEIGHETGKWGFPVRNKLMAGISHATLVVEAAQGSGSLMTAKHAESYDRDVMAIPGQITNSNSYGPHMLIKRGAMMVTDASDILENFGFCHSTNKPRIDMRINNLEPLSKFIVEALMVSERTNDYFIDKLTISPAELNRRLTNLELEGLIKIGNESIRIC